MITQKTIMSNILVTGCNGQLGLEIKELSENYSNYQMVYTDISKLDLTEHDAVMRYFNENDFEIPPAPQANMNNIRNIRNNNNSNNPPPPDYDGDGFHPGGLDEEEKNPNDDYHVI